MSKFPQVVSYMLHLKHSNCVTLLGYIINPKPILIMKKYPRSLSTIIYNEKDLSLELKKKYNLGIVFLEFNFYTQFL